MVYHCGSVLAPYSSTIVSAILPGLIPGQAGELRGMVDNFAGATARIVSRLFLQESSFLLARRPISLYLTRHRLPHTFGIFAADRIAK
jgi:hypothetical protein